MWRSFELRLRVEMFEWLFVFHALALRARLGKKITSPAYFRAKSGMKYDSGHVVAKGSRVGGVRFIRRFRVETGTQVERPACFSIEPENGTEQNDLVHAGERPAHGQHCSLSVRSEESTVRAHAQV